MALEVQQRSFLTRQLTAAIATPIVLLLALGLVLGHQLLRMSEDAQWVDHTDAVIGVANDTLRQMIDQETGARGYFLTRDRAFLEPFDRARPRNGLTRLHGMLLDDPGQQARFDEARRRYEEWLAAVSPLLTAPGPDNPQSLDEARFRKTLMDTTREAMRSAIDYEEELRRTRVTASMASTASTKALFIVLLAGSALALAVLSRRHLKSIASTFGDALDAEQSLRQANENEAWVRGGQARVAGSLQGERDLAQLGEGLLAELAGYVQADVGAFFTREGGGWRRQAGYSLDARSAGPATFADGEGLVGRVAREGAFLHLREVPADFLKVRSGTGEALPVEVALIPALANGSTNAVLELGFLRRPEARALELLGRIGDGIGASIRSAEYKQRLRDLLEQSQRQAEALQTQQEELRVVNEELEAQSSALRSVQEQLEAERAELEQTNENLTTQSHLLERQNQRLADNQREIAAKAREVQRASQFKSDFLSNMSHELRTPLNSSLILAKLLADNREGNLSSEQVKFAETIYSAGNDLLLLINDVLDLSKVESGKMEVHAGRVHLDQVRTGILRTFEPLVREKKLHFDVLIDASAATLEVETDAQRLDQILRNLVSNAIKFTDRGEVVVHVSGSDERIVFSVTDTGIGISPEQQTIVFDAFRQADGTTSRKHGGTGLGLSISRELARLLGGDISVTSEPGKGSTFTLSIPRIYEKAIAEKDVKRPLESVLRAAVEVPAENEPALDPSRRAVLIVEDDEAFSDILADVVREAGFQPLVASTAKQGFALARKHVPMGIVLDMKLPDHSGLSVLDRLKRDPITRHVPVHVVSVQDYVETALSMGAAAYLLKPVKREQLVEAIHALEARSDHKVRHVLVVEDDDVMRKSIANLLGRNDIEISGVPSVAQALELLRTRTFDCIVTDLALSDGTGFELLETMSSHEPYSVPPVIVYTGRDLTMDEEQHLRKYSRTIIIKGARSPERLLDEVTLFLHQVESDLPADKQRLLAHVRHRETVFEGRTILIVEDDVRNVFALTSVLEPKGARVQIARNGKEALDALEKAPTIDLVLMDIMMPEMDGLTAMRFIRQQPRWQKLPIIALTAKAMRDDHERCLAAGANDYLAKPLDVDVLLSLLRVWMPKSR